MQRFLRAALIVAVGPATGIGQEQAEHPAGRVLRLDVDGGPPDVVVFDGRGAHVWFGTGAAPWFRPGPTTALASAPLLGGPVVADARLAVAMQGDGLDPRPRVVARAFDRAGRGAGTQVWRVGTAVGGVVPRIEAMELLPSPTEPGTILAVWSEDPAPPGIAVWVASLVPGRSPSIVPLAVAATPAARVVGFHDAPAIATPSARLLLVLERRGAGVELLRLIPRRGPWLDIAGGAVLPWFPAFSLRDHDPLAASSVVGVIAPMPAFASPILHPVGTGMAVLHHSTRPPWLGTSGAAVPWPDQVTVRLLPDSAADYDADGDEEIAACVRDVTGHEWLAVFDPHPLGTSVAIAAVPGEPHPEEFHVAHGAPVDVDGDGRPELVVSWQPEPGVARLGVLRVRGDALVGSW